MNNPYNYKIYKIVCLKTNLTYYGATKDRLSKIMTIYSSYYRCFLRGTYHYNSIFEILKNQHYTIILIEKCENKEQLNEKLRTLIDNNECVNKLKPLMNKEQIKEYRSNHYKLNKEHYKQYQREYYKLNRETILQKQNDLRNQNREAFINFYKQYYQDNKEKLNEKLTCECGGHYLYNNKSSHFKTQKHKKYLEEQNK